MIDVGDEYRHDLIRPTRISYWSSCNWITCWTTSMPNNSYLIAITFLYGTNKILRFSVFEIVQSPPLLRCVNSGWAAHNFSNLRNRVCPVNDEFIQTDIIALQKARFLRPLIGFSLIRAGLSIPFIFFRYSSSPVT